MFKQIWYKNDQGQWCWLPTLAEKAEATAAKWRRQGIVDVTVLDEGETPEGVEVDEHGLVVQS